MTVPDYLRFRFGTANRTEPETKIFAFSVIGRTQQLERSGSCAYR